MRTKSMCTLGFSILLAAGLLMLTTACAEKKVGVNEAVVADVAPPEVGSNDIEMYFRDVDLMVESNQDLAEYLDEEPGDSELVPRAFKDAPPAIPHAFEDDDPLTADENGCLDCHHPDMAEEGDIPMTASHFQIPVMAQGGADGAMAWIVTGYVEGDELSGARHNCTMCHAPRASNVRTPESAFVSE